MQVIPNSVLAKGSFTNLSRPNRHHYGTITVDFSYDDPPNKVKRVLRTTASRTPGVLEEPSPGAAIQSYKKRVVRYVLVFHVADYAQVDPIRDELLTRIWYAAHSTASDRVIASTPAFAHAEGTTNAEPVQA